MKPPSGFILLGGFFIHLDVSLSQIPLSRKEDPMFKLKWLVVLVLFLISVQPSFADDRAKLLGIWKLISVVGEFQDKPGEYTTGIYGNNPTGYIIFTSEGRMMVVIEGEGRKPAKTDDERAFLYRSMNAYTGMYRVEGDKFLTKVDVSWNPAWNGTEQVRGYKFEGDRLLLQTPWAPSTATPGKISRGVFTWERVK